MPARRRGLGLVGAVGRRLLSFWFLGKLLALGLLAAGGWVVSQAAVAPDLRVVQVSIEGTALLDADAVREALSLEGTHLFLVRRGRVVRQLEAMPLVARASADVRLPNQVRVRVVERSAAAVWDTGVRQLLSDSDGLILREGSMPLPIVHAPAGPLPEPGQRVDPVAIHVAQAVGPRLEMLGLAGGRVEYQPESGVAIVAPGSPRVVLGFGEDVDAKLTAYLSIRRYLDETKRPAELIDVRFLERPYFR